MDRTIPFLELKTFPRFLPSDELCSREWVQPGDREAFEELQRLRRENAQLKQELAEQRELFDHYVRTAKTWPHHKRKISRENRDKSECTTKKNKNQVNYFWHSSIKNQHNVCSICSCCILSM